LFKLFVAIIPAGVLGVLFDDFMKEHLMTPWVVAVALVVGGVLILVIEARVTKYRFKDAGRIPLWVALVIGLAQCLAMIPGTSRSGATIMAALVLGLSPAAAAEFSFFLAIPTLLGAGILSLVKAYDTITPEQYLPLVVGFVVSFLVAWIVVAAFMRFIQSHKFTVFAIYRIVLGAVVVGWYLIR
jgi:undecaprenyl-diphosphatase